MKKLNILVTTVTAFTFLLISWAFSTTSSNNAAVHIGPIDCGVLDGNGNGYLATGNINISSSGNGKMTCKTKDAPNATGSAVIWNNANTGYLCSLPGGITSDWQNVVSSSGNITLQCKLRP